MLRIKRQLVEFDTKLERLVKPQFIVIHHTDEIGWDVYKTHEYHKSLGWDGIGYNYFIEENGDIVEGRGMYVGAHAKGYNNRAIGVCISGDFDLNYPTHKQMRSVYWLCKYLMKKYKIDIKHVLAHRELDGVNKSCPGFNFDMNEFRILLSK